MLHDIINLELPLAELDTACISGNQTSRVAISLTERADRKHIIHRSPDAKSIESNGRPAQMASRLLVDLCRTISRRIKSQRFGSTHIRDQTLRLFSPRRLSQMQNRWDDGPDPWLNHPAELEALELLL